MKCSIVISAPSTIKNLNYSKNCTPLDIIILVFIFWNFISLTLDAWNMIKYLRNWSFYSVFFFVLKLILHKKEGNLYFKKNKNTGRNMSFSKNRHLFIINTYLEMHKMKPFGRIEQGSVINKLSKHYSFDCYLCAICQQES